MAEERSDLSDVEVEEPRRDQVPESVYVACPECAEETRHDVLKGHVSPRGPYALQATARCEECLDVHNISIREPPAVEVPVIVSRGAESHRVIRKFPGDEELALDQVIEVEGHDVLVTGLELEGGRRTDRAPVGDVRTVWVKDFENITLGFAINLGHRTITKAIPAEPDTRVTVGEEYVFGRLRVVVHAIKIKDKPIKRDGSAEAADIVRVFAKPARIGRKQYRPTKEARERQAAREERRGG